MERSTNQICTSDLAQNVSQFSMQYIQKCLLARARVSFYCKSTSDCYSDLVKCHGPYPHCTIMGAEKNKREGGTEAKWTPLGFLSRHSAMIMNVTKQKSEHTIRKCITIPWGAAKGRNKETKGSQRAPNGNQMGAKAMPKGDQKETKTELKGCQNDEGTSKSILCGTGANNLGKGMRKGSQCMPKGCQHEAKLAAQSHTKSMKTQVKNKLMEVMKMITKRCHNGTRNHNCFKLFEER